MKPIRIYNRILGLLLILFGGMLLITSPSLFDLLHYTNTYWPVLLILYGLHLLCKDKPLLTRQNAAPLSSNTQELNRHSRLFGNLQLNLDALPTGDRYHITFGNIRVHTEPMVLGPGEKTLILSVFCGDIHIRTRRETAIKVSAEITLGHLAFYKEKQNGVSVEKSYQSPAFASAEAKLHIICRVVMGSIKIF